MIHGAFHPEGSAVYDIGAKLVKHVFLLEHLYFILPKLKGFRVFWIFYLVAIIHYNPAFFYLSFDSFTTSRIKAVYKDWSSCSAYEVFQARRAGIRYRKADGKAGFAGTLNGSGVALARLVVAILESCQQADGSVALPEAIVPYMDGVDRLLP